MSTVRALVPVMRRAGGRDQRLTTALAVGAFAVTTALTLVVVGGLVGFMARADHPHGAVQREDGEMYVYLAWVAVVLLIVPLLSLGGAAARLGVARRDARLATLRLLGATANDVVLLTVIETAVQGLVGAVVGVVGYLAVLPVFTLLPFQGQRFGYGEMWVGPWVLLGVCGAVPLLAAISAAVSLRRVVVSPLGVARRQTPRGLRWVRALVAGVGVITFMVVTSSMGAFGAAAGAAMIGALALGFATINVVGPWTLSILGRIQLRWARRPAQLLAARRLMDDPRGAWRVVGGLGLAGFVAGALAVIPVITADASQSNLDATDTIIFGDLMRGAMLTLVLTYLLAAASAGITQAASVIDRRREYALAALAGTPVELLDDVRRRVTIVPMLFCSVGSALTALIMLFPLAGLAAVRAPEGLLTLLACLVGGSAMVVAATETSRPLLRSVLAGTVVRAD